MSLSFDFKLLHRKNSRFIWAFCIWLENWIIYVKFSPGQLNSSFQPSSSFLHRHTYWWKQKAFSMQSMSYRHSVLTPATIIMMMMERREIKVKNMKKVTSFEISFDIIMHASCLFILLSLFFFPMHRLCSTATPRFLCNDNAMW